MSGVRFYYIEVETNLVGFLNVFCFTYIVSTCHSASAILSPLANTNTLCDLPVPFGNTTAPRICWSFLRVSIPKRNATSTEASKLAKCLFL